MRGHASIVSVLAAALLLGGGFAAGLFVAGDQAPEGEPTEITLHRKARPADPLEALEAAELPSEPELEGRPDPVLVDLRRAIDALPEPVVRRGSGVITGFVKTEAGEPLTGVTVAAAPRTEAGAPKRAAPSEDMAANVRGIVHRMRLRKMSLRTTTTGEDGSFRFDDLINVAHQISATLDGWRIRPGRDARKAKPGAELTLEARRVHRVHVDVTLPDGSEPERASLMFRSGSSMRSHGWRPDGKTVEMQPGTYEVSARGGEDDEFGSETVPLTIDPEEPTPHITLHLGAKPSLRVAVEFPEGESARRTQVRLRRLGKTQTADPALLGGGTTSQHIGFGRDAGNATVFRELKPGRYLVGVTRTYGGPIVATSEVQVGDARAVVTLQVPPLDPKDFVAVRVLDPGGKPLSDVRISTSFKSGTTSRSGGGTLIPRQDGTYWLLRDPQVDPKLADGVYAMHLSHKRYGSRTVEYSPDAAGTVEVRFGAPVALKVVVAGIRGGDYEGRVQAGLATASTATVGYPNVARPRALADDGSVSFPGIQPGDYRLVLTLSGGRFGGSIASFDVTVGKSGGTRTVTFPTLYEVAFEGVTGQVYVMPKDGVRMGRHRFAQADSSGRAVLDGLATGTYTAQSGAKTAEFTLPGATTVRLE